MNKRLLFLALIVSLTGCLKRDERHVNVPCSGNCLLFNIQVTTGVNDSVAVQGASVELGWNRPATPIGDAGRLIATGKTADGGRIAFSFKANDKELTGGKYYITVKKGDDYFVGSNAIYGITTADTIINMPVHLYSKASLKIIYKNFSPADSSDFFECSPNIRNYGSDIFPVEMKKDNGEGVNTFFFYDNAAFSRLELHGETAGDDYTYINVIKNKGGNRTNIHDSLYIPKGRTATYEVTW